MLDRDVDGCVVMSTALAALLLAAPLLRTPRSLTRSRNYNYYYCNNSNFVVNIMATQYKRVGDLVYSKVEKVVCVALSRSCS